MQVFRFNDPPAADALHGGTVAESAGSTDGTGAESAPADLPDLPAANPSTSSQVDGQVATSNQELLQPSTSLLVGQAAAGSGQLMMQSSVQQQQAAKEYSGAASAAASAVLTVALGMAAAVWSI
jgi:hypothetical protein